MGAQALAEESGSMGTHTDDEVESFTVTEQELDPEEIMRKIADEAIQCLEAMKTAPEKFDVFVQHLDAIGSICADVVESLTDGEEDEAEIVEV